MSGDYVCAHIIVKGLVQGVGFRWFVQSTEQSIANCMDQHIAIGMSK
ncbi:Acylphosphatase [Candidatus Kryptonium thompsonii]|nr:Acylphosphatase [Candidatus Kryptonium thompsoni]